MNKSIPNIFSGFIISFFILQYHPTVFAHNEIPFGGEGSDNLAFEAVLANKLMNQFNSSNLNSKIKEILIGIPVKILESNHHPFGDGQSNATFNYGNYWKSKNPIVIVRREVLKSGEVKDYFEWDASLNIVNNPDELNIIKINQDDLFFKPKSWRDWFYVSFKIESYEISKVVNELGSIAQLSANRTLPDPEKIKLELKKDKSSSLDAFKKHQWGPGYNSMAYWSDSVHGEYPLTENTWLTTSVGGVSTWLVTPGIDSQLKHLYTCFQGRQFDAEKKFGVPSGAGLHKIGDAAESIVNSIESLQLPVVYGKSNSSAVLPNGSKLSYDLTHTLVARLLNPGELFLTSQSNYHWYVNPTEKEFCVEIWVHQCVPKGISNNWGFTCH